MTLRRGIEISAKALRGRKPREQVRKPVAVELPEGWADIATRIGGVSDGCPYPVGSALWCALTALRTSSTVGEFVGEAARLREHVRSLVHLKAVATAGLVVLEVEGEDEQ